MQLMGRCRLSLTWVLLAGVFHSFAATRALPAEPAVAADDQQFEADMLLDAARNAAARNDLETAMQRFREFRERYPDRADGRRGYADALFQSGRVREATAEYEWLLKLHPDDSQLVRTYVDALLNMGDHPRAKRQLVDAMVRFPDRVDFALSLALL